MSLLPNTMLPPSAPLGRVIDEKGEIQQNITVRIETNWWLLLYNLSQQVLGIGAAGLPASALIELGQTNSFANDADAIALRQPISSLAVQEAASGGIKADVADVASARKIATNALLLAQTRLLADPVPAAQPVASITVGASPYQYTAPFSGAVAVTGGTVSAIAIIRQGTTVATGLTVGVFPLSRGDILKITHTGAPTATFLPT